MAMCKIWRQSKIMLHGYRWLYTLHKKGKFLRIYVYLDIAKNVEIRFDASNYELQKPFLWGVYNKVIPIMEEEQEVHDLSSCVLHLPHA